MDRRVVSASAAVCALVLAAAGCSQALKLAAIAPENVPQEVKDSYSALHVPDLIWRVCRLEGEKWMVALTGTMTAADGSRRSMYWISYRSASGSAASTGPFEPDLPFHSWPICFWKPTPWGERYVVAAMAMALDRRAVEVAGFTTEGRSVRTVPVNGFWVLSVTDPAPDEAWVTVRAVDSDGRVLFPSDVAREAQRLRGERPPVGN